MNKTVCGVWIISFVGLFFFFSGIITDLVVTFYLLPNKDQTLCGGKTENCKYVSMVLTPLLTILGLLILFLAGIIIGYSERKEYGNVGNCFSLYFYCLGCAFVCHSKPTFEDVQKQNLAIWIGTIVSCAFTLVFLLLIIFIFGIFAISLFPGMLLGYIVGIIKEKTKSAPKQTVIYPKFDV